ncbi:MAG: hypothetical protein JXB00_13865 [Bacteroidales bacterium]|nr:hypothetical protein [Bacteroidales bacterium]
MLRLTIEEFKETLEAPEPPEYLNNLLQALWFDAKGDGEAALELAQVVYTNEGYWVHGYLLRKQGDLENAAQWYKKAGRSLPKNSFDEEWKMILSDFLE